MFKQTFKNFKISFNALNERNTVSAGDPVTGQISFDVTKETKITSITLKLTGNAHVHWSSGGSGGRNRRRNRKHYSAKIEFFNIKTVIAQESGAINQPIKLQPGTHSYEFTSQLPAGDFPSSFHGAHGKIVYNLMLGIKRSWHLTKDFVTQLNFVHYITETPELLAPLEGFNSMTLCCLWCTSGPISMTARMEKKVFVPGETVKITCNLSNAAFQKATPRAILCQKQTYYTISQTNRRLVVKQLASVKGQPVSAHRTDVHSEIMLTIPSNVPFTISNCRILVVEYVIEVKFGIKTCPDVVVLFPIIIHDGAVPAQCLPY
ncbi:hypothetical protein LDENG_00268760 [Lucifuga dentata]|nr:hypothetical protein LDENG_00268760 [Lucifuga dentata]